MAYEKFFGLKETPFRLTPDPDYYFPSEVHKEALQTLLYSIRAGEGFVQITGQPGTGKTLILRTILRQLGNEVTTALILNPRLSPEDLLRVILEDFGLDPFQIEAKTKEEHLRYFRDFLLGKAREGQKVVVIIDEAQNLPSETMEELRLLSNLETEKEKLLQIILVGQVELEEKLRSDELKQLNQRITIRYRLKPLNKTDTIAYIYHRIRIAGGGEHIRFAPTVLDKIHKLSKGVPRLVNIICERALMAAYVEGKNTIEKDQVKKAMESIVGEEELEPAAASIFRRTPALLLMVLLLVAAIGIGYWFLGLSQQKTSVIYATPESERAALVEKEAKIKEKEAALRRKEALVSKKVSDIDKKHEIIAGKEEALSDKELALREKEEALQQEEAELKKSLGEKKANLQQKEAVVSKKASEIDQQEEILGKKEEELSEKERALLSKEEELRRKEAELGEVISKGTADLTQKEAVVSTKASEVDQQEEILGKKEEELSEKERALRAKEEELQKKEAALGKKEIIVTQKEQALSEKEVAARQEKASLRPREETQGETGAVVAKIQPPPLPQDAATAASRPFPPPEAFIVPKDRYFLAVNCDIKKVFVFRGTGAAPLLKAEFEFPWPLGEGLFIVGNDASIGEFIFHHMSFLWGKPYLTATDLWEKVSHLVPGHAVPLMAYSSRTRVNTAEIEKAHQLEQIVGSWTEAWRNMDVDKLLDYYGDIFTTYSLDLEKPTVFSKDQFYARKKEVLMKSGFVSVKTSQPLFILDPDNPKLAVAFFHQEYRSQVYADAGAKALYFSLVDEPGGGQTWKIVAKLWLPSAY